MSIARNEQDRNLPAISGYSSLFNQYYMSQEALLAHNPKANKLTYRGHFKQVLGELEKAVVNSKDVASLPILVWHPARVIRAAMNYKINHPFFPDKIDLVRSAIDLGLQIFQNPAGSEKIIADFITKATNMEPRLLGFNVTQTHDQTTWNATNHNLSQATAERLADRLKDPDVFFLALGHGGVAAGLDVYLRLLDITKSQRSDLYTVRYSRDKMKDIVPQADEDELAMIRQEIDGRRLIIFDEDTDTGGTLKGAKTFFEDKLSLHSGRGKIKPQISLATNLDYSGHNIEDTSWLNTVLNNPAPDVLFEGINGAL